MANNDSAAIVRRPRAQKRDAITDAARTVFGREGFARTSIDAIAEQAGVSTRTIYNHFEGKEQLFRSVLEASATQVADTFLERAEAQLTGDGLERDLTALGTALVAQPIDFPEHFAMVRQINAEAAHFPPDVIEAWQEAGPRRVEREVARRLAGLADRGLLRVADPAVAAVHFIALISALVGPRSFRGAKPPTRAVVRRSVEAGVRAFLDGYGAGERGAASA